MRTMVVAALCSSVMLLLVASGESYLRMWEFKKRELPDNLRATAIQQHRGFSPLKCSVGCSLRKACFAFQHLPSTSSCTLFRRSQNRLIDAQSNEYYTVTDPTTCSEIRKLNPTVDSGEYTIWPSAPQFRGIPVKVFCSMTDTRQLEYVTLPNENIGNYPKRSNGRCNRELPYLEGHGVGNDGVTVYHKIRIDPLTMAIGKRDTTYTSGNKTEPHAYGEACDCYSYWGACKRIGTFHIDTLGTGMKFATNLRWKSHGMSAIVHSINRTHGGAIIDIVCGGWCGSCRPIGDMILFPNNADIQSLSRFI